MGPRGGPKKWAFPAGTGRRTVRAGGPTSESARSSPSSSGIVRRGRRRVSSTRLGCTRYAKHFDITEDPLVGPRSSASRGPQLRHGVHGAHPAPRPACALPRGCGPAGMSRQSPPRSRASWRTDRIGRASTNSSNQAITASTTRSSSTGVPADGRDAWGLNGFVVTTASRGRRSAFGASWCRSYPTGRHGHGHPSSRRRRRSACSPRSSGWAASIAGQTSSGYGACRGHADRHCRAARYGAPGMTPQSRRRSRPSFPGLVAGRRKGSFVGPVWAGRWLRCTTTAGPRYGSSDLA